MNDNSGIIIRELKIWEVPELLRFRVANDYNAPFEDKDVRSESVFYALLKMLWHGERMANMVAIKDGSIVGYISLVFGKHKKFKGNAYLINAAVSRSERNQGIGTALFNEIENYSRKRGARRIEFDVFASNTRAIKLYEKLGYEIEGVKRRAVENSHGFDDLIFMAKFL